MSLDAKLEASKQCVKKTKCDIPALENIYDSYFMRSVFKLYFLFIIGEKTSKMRVNQLVLSVFVCPPYSCFTELFSGAFPGLSDTPEWSWLIFSCIVLCYKIGLKHFDSSTPSPWTGTQGYFNKLMQKERNHDDTKMYKI